MLLLLLALLLGAGMADAGEMTAPLPMLQMNPLLLRYMGSTNADAFAVAGEGHRFSIQEHYANIFLGDRFPVPDRYLVDMELSVTKLTLHASVGKLALHLDLPLLLSTGGWMDGLINGFHKAFHYPNHNRQYRPNNSYAYRLAGAWNSHPGWQLGNISAGLQYPVWRREHNALAILAGVKLPTASRQLGWGSGTWDAGAGLVDSVRIGPWFSHLEAWYFRPFGSDFVPFLKNRAYVRGAFSIGVRGRFFRPISARPFSLIIQAQGGMSPYHGNGLLITGENPWLVAAGLRWQDSHARDWLFSITENITQQSSQDISFNIGCAFG
jgi:hypothetical protein